MSWSLVELRDRRTIECLLRPETALHLYELGDLAEPHWPRTKWYGAEKEGRVESLVMLYDMEPAPVFFVMEDKGAATRWLINTLAPDLPPHLYVQAAESLMPTFDRCFVASIGTPQMRMILKDFKPAAKSSHEVRMLGANDLASLEAFYGEAYEGHWFAAEMLATGCFFGAFAASQLVSVAGTHILAAASGIAALGNIATAPAHRGQGLAQAVTSALCAELQPKIPTIGLNVRIDNHTAVRCYKNLGFVDVACFHELYADVRPGTRAPR